MKPLLTYFLIISLLLTFAQSCQKSESEIFVSVTCSESEAESGSWIQFYLDFSSNSRILQDCIVRTYDACKGSDVIDTISIKRENYTDIYMTLASYTTDTLMVDYIFSVRDDAGKNAEYTYKMRILPGKDQLLDELTAVELFAGVEGKNDGFDLKSEQPVCTRDSKADFRLDFNDGILCFKTDTNVMFVKQNTFDYSSATVLSVQTAFCNSLRSSSVSPVLQGDVVLIGRAIDTGDDSFSLSALGVMKILIVDDRRIIMNIKLINK